MAYLYEHDILNRYSGHTLTKTTDGDVITWTLKDGSDAFVARSKGISGDDEYILKDIRRALSIDDSVRPCLTTVQRDLMTLPLGQDIYNSTTDAPETKAASTWE